MFIEYTDAQQAEADLINAEYDRHQEQERREREYVRWRIEGVLRAHGVKLKIGGCGCCGSPWIEADFPDGYGAKFDSFHLDTFEPYVSDQEG